MYNIEYIESLQAFFRCPLDPKHCPERPNTQRGPNWKLLMSDGRRCKGVEGARSGMLGLPSESGVIKLAHEEGGSFCRVWQSWRFLVFARAPPLLPHHLLLSWSLFHQLDAPCCAISRDIGFQSSSVCPSYDIRRTIFNHVKETYHLPEHGLLLVVLVLILRHGAEIQVRSPTPQIPSTPGA